MMQSSSAIPEGPPRVALVTGAMGAVGSSVARGLNAAGYRVRAYDLLPLGPNQIPEIAENFQGDINDSTRLREAAKGVDLIVHLAAKLHINSPAASLRDEYRRVNVEGTRCVADAAVAQKVRRLVFASTICVYGASQPSEILDEDSPVHCNSWYTETKCEAEQIVLQCIPSVVLRFASVYGPRMKGNYVRLLNALDRGRFAYVGDGLNRRTMVFDEDVARAVALAAVHPAAGGKIYNVTDGNIHAFREIVEAMCQALNRRPPRLHVPVAFVKACVGAAAMGATCLGRRGLVSRQLVEKLIEDVAVSSRRIERELQFQSQIGLAEGWRRVVNEQKR